MFPIIEQQKRSDTLCVTVFCLHYYKVIVGMTVPDGLVGHMSYFANKNIRKLSNATNKG